MFNKKKDVSKSYSTNCIDVIAWLNTQKKNNILCENNAKINLIDSCQMSSKVDSQGILQL